MSESLRNDGRIWVPKRKEDRLKPPASIAEADRDYYLERIYPSFGNLCPRDVASRAAKRVCDEGRGVGETGLGVYLDFADAIARLGEGAVRERYGNLFDIYHEITNENAYKVPMRIFPAVHYTMGGLWVDYNLMSNVPGLFVLGEANFSDHGANRLGASALMQGLADGYFVLPYTIGDYLAAQKPGSRPSADGAEFAQAEENVKAMTSRLLAVKGTRAGEPFPQAARPHHVAALRDGPQQGRASRRRCRRSPRCARSSGRTSACPAAATPQPVARAGGPGRRLPRARRADVPRRPGAARRAAAAISARSTSTPTASASATTPTSPTWPPGSTRARARSPGAQRRAARLRVRSR